MRSFGHHFDPVVGEVFELPAQQHDGYAGSPDFTHQRRVIGIRNDQYDDVDRPAQHEFISFERQPDIHPAFFPAALYIAQRQVVGIDSFGHQDVVEYAVVVQLVASHSCFRSIEAPPEIMCDRNLAFDRFTARLFGYTVPDEPVQAIQAQPSPFGVDIVIVVGGVQQEIPVIKYADTAGGIDRIHSD